MTVTVTSALAGPATARYSNVYGALVDLGVLSGLGAQDVTGSGDPVAPILNASEFYAPLTHSLVLTRGTGSATYTRATKAWEFGYAAAANAGADQVLIEVATGTPRFGGARYDSGTWYNTYADGSAISASSLLGYHAEGARTNSLLWSRDLRKAEYIKLGYGSELITNGDFSIDVSSWTASADAIITHVSGRMLVTSTVADYRYAYQAVTTSIGATYVVNVNLEKTTGIAIYIRIGETAGGKTLVDYGIMKTGANNYSVTFTATTTTTYISFSTGNDVIGEGPYVDNVSVKLAAMQVSTCTGIDNVADSASTLTAGAANATILQTLTMAAAARSFSAYVKRRTGTGNVYITRDGGTNWTDITSSLGASWTRVKIENTSVLNPQVGFKIATSGDAIDVDVCQDEAGGAASSPIITTTAAITRNADVLTYPATSNISNINGTALLTGNCDVNGSGYGGSHYLLTNDNTYFFIAHQQSDPTTIIGTFSGAALLLKTGVPNFRTSQQKFAVAWVTGGNIGITAAGLIPVSSPFVSMASMTTINIGTSQAYGHIKDAYIWQSALTDAQLQQVTA